MIWLTWTVAAWKRATPSYYDYARATARSRVCLACGLQTELTLSKPKKEEKLRFAQNRSMFHMIKREEMWFIAGLLMGHCQQHADNAFSLLHLLD